MATLTTLTNRLLVAGGFAVAIAAAPVMVALSTPAAPSSPALAECPSTEVADPVTGACQPISDVAPPTTNPVNPEGAALAPGALTEGTGSGNVGQLPEVAGIPCTGGNIGQCIGLQEATGQNNAAGVELPPVPVGVQP
jgi:hypothetical protein